MDKNTIDRKIRLLLDKSVSLLLTKSRSKSSYPAKAWRSDRDKILDEYIDMLYQVITGKTKDQPMNDKE